MDPTAADIRLKWSVRERDQERERERARIGMRFSASGHEGGIPGSEPSRDGNLDGTAPRIVSDRRVLEPASRLFPAREAPSIKHVRRERADRSAEERVGQEVLALVNALESHVPSAQIRDGRGDLLQDPRPKIGLVLRTEGVAHYVREKGHGGERGRGMPAGSRSETITVRTPPVKDRLENLRLERGSPNAESEDGRPVEAEGPRIAAVVFRCREEDACRSQAEKPEEE